MPKAILTLDTEDGEMKLDLFLEGGFQVESNAHQAAGILIKHLEELGSVTNRSDARELTEDEAREVIEAAQGQQAVGDAPAEIVAGAKRPVLQLVAP
jgi:hypothetical protein